MVNPLRSRNRVAVMRMGSEPLLEAFMIFAIGTILVIRVVLASLGYPQLGGAGLHITHMLWGGLLLIAALVILMTSIGWYTLAAGAVLGGVGFGFFIDEVGKFVTSDNNYFYRPAVSIMYVVFVLLFIVFQAIGRRLPASHTYLVNALEATQEALIRGLTRDQEERAREMLSHADPHDPITGTLSSLLDQIELVPAPEPNRVWKTAINARAGYDRVLRSPPFRVVLVTAFVLLALISGGSALTRIGFNNGLTVSEWGELVSNAVVAVLVSAGLVRLQRSRVGAYRWLLRAVLVSLLVTQPFTFYRQQFSALWGFAIGLLVWGVLRYMIELEETSPTVETPPAGLSDGRTATK
jgi:hypothetical protein